ncbi:TPA: hypothetical protein ROY30_001434 [Bacillus cereus]|uniref:hypothetical protein n=1 Tax=Bacillales TaxID=1385 RepID=UPI00086452FB|nr:MULTISPECIES: hypothetical protein [Bacillales]MCP1177250.1 hypothetical protein [Bacillus sp. 1663tsa1]MCP1283167.1 hypothetical protein [Bacillus sp. S0635]MCQ6347442.1 hypothetical protein [Bacillus cereus]MCU5458998.1 hypothetical protein [Bacillus cereus]MCU5748409.1 hypothetical protein [Bacillus cereus]
MANTTLFRLSNVQSLGDVIENILSIKSEEKIKHVTPEQLKLLSSDDRVFVSEWTRYQEISEDILELNVPDRDPVKYLVREAYIETSKWPKNMFENGRLLPKPQRIVTENIKTLFFEKNEEVYCIIFTTSAVSLNKIKQKLFNEEQPLECVGDSYELHSDLFYWLFDKYEEGNKIIATRFEIEGISGFLGNIADENHKIKGDSDITTKLLVTKAFVSKFYPITAIDIMLKYHDYRLDFVFNQQSECSLRSSSHIPNFQDEKDLSAALIIYSFIIPLLKELFEEDSEWSPEKKGAFSKKMGMEVIREIAQFNNIGLEFK